MSPPCTPPRRQPTTPAGASPANTATTRDNHSNNNKGTITNPCTPPPRPQPTTPAGASPAHTATTRDNNNKPSPVMNAPRAPPPARAPVPAAAAIAATIALLQGLGYAAPDTNNSSSSSQSSSKDNNNNILTGQDMVTTLTEMMNKRVTRLVDEIERDRRELRSIYAQLGVSEEGGGGNIKAKASPSVVLSSDEGTRAGLSTALEGLLTAIGRHREECEAIQRETMFLQRITKQVEKQEGDAGLRLDAKGQTGLAGAMEDLMM